MRSRNAFRSLAHLVSLGSILTLASACASSSGHGWVSPASDDCIGALTAIAPDPTNQRPGGPSSTPPKLVRRVEPVPPLNLVGRARTATVDAAVGADGVPKVVCIVEGDREWGMVLADAVKQWRFEPGTIDEQPVPMRLSVTASMN